MNQQYLEILEILRPIDNEFMKVLFKNQNCVELLVKTIFGDDVSLMKFETEDERKNLQGRSIGMDIVATLSDGKIINIEMEKSEENATPLRARYHASILDCSESFAGEEWNQIEEMYVVFICEDDFLKTNKIISHINRYIDEVGRLFNDKLHIIYLNASIEDESPLGLLMHDLMCRDPDQMHYEVLKTRASYFKKSEGGKYEMCKELEKIVVEREKLGEERGEKRGILKGKIETLMKILIKRFANENLEWVKECNEEQIEKIEKNIFKEISYKDFYQLVHS